MHDPKLSKKYATAQGPVNRRTAPVAAPAPTPPAPIALARLHMTQARQRLGAPLAQQLAAPRHDPVRPGPSSTTIAQTIGGTVGAVGVLLGAIQGSWLTLGASASLLCGLGGWVAWCWHRRPANPSAAFTPATWVEPTDLQRLDSLMEQLAAEVPDDTVQRLCDIKTALRHSVALLAHIAADSGLPTEDALYVRECVRRYLPDSIQSCLQVPQKDRATRAIEGNRSALALLHEQIGMLMGELQTREARLTQLAGEPLLRQQRFLAAKTGHQG